MSARPIDLRFVDAWRAQLGLMPVPLRATALAEETAGYILLNGSRGSFYLDQPRAAEPTHAFRTNSWSTNVGHSVAVVGRDVVVQRWDRRSSNRYSVAAVADDLERFHRELERDAPPADTSVVAHGIRSFRSVRQALGESFSSFDALLAFLVLLGTSADGIGRDALDVARWYLPERARNIADELGATTWAALADQFEQGRAIDDLAPDVRLMLRHASGALFQEAHHIAIFDPYGTRWLLPTPRPVDVNIKPSSSAAHYTPASITRSIVERALLAAGVLPTALTVLDPACGSGEFLREALRQLRLSGYAGTVRLFGFDISEAACAMARFALAAELNTDAGGPDMDVMIDIVCADALGPIAVWPEHIDFVLTNPPFASWTDMSAETRTTVLEVLGPLANRRPDLASAFLLRAAVTLRDGGVLGSVVPASIFDGTSAAGVRGALAEILAPELIARLGSHQLFFAARVDAGLYIARRGLAHHPPIALWADHKETSSSAALRTLRRLGSSDQYPVIRSGFDIYLNPAIGRDETAWAPRPYHAWKASDLLKGGPTVGSTFDVRQGILTGLNRVFILDEDGIKKLPRNERFAFRKAIVNESIEGGRVTSTVWVFYPYGTAAIESEDDLAERLPTYYRHFLTPSKSQLAARSRRTPENWWKLTEYRKWQLDPSPKIVSTYFGDSGSFAFDPRGELAVVQGYAWLAKRSVNRAGWFAVLSVVSSRRFSALLSAHSNHVGGGQWNLSKRFVAEVPLPDIFDMDGDLLRELAVVGERIHETGLMALSAEELGQLDEIVTAAYALPTKL